MLVAALHRDGKHAAAFPMFGFERRGAPVSAFVRIDDKPIREKTQIYTPNCLIVLDPPQVKSPMIYAGLKPHGILVANYPGQLEEKPNENIELVGTANAAQIALEEIGIPAFNSCIIATFAATTKWVTIESILVALEHHFTGELLKKNLRSAERGYHEVNITKF